MAKSNAAQHAGDGNINGSDRIIKGGNWELPDVDLTNVELPTPLPPPGNPCWCYCHIKGREALPNSSGSGGSKDTMPETLHSKKDVTPGVSEDTMPDEKEYCKICGKLIGKPGKLYIAGTICPGHEPATIEQIQDKLDDPNAFTKRAIKKYAHWRNQESDLEQQLREILIEGSVYKGSPKNEFKQFLVPQFYLDQAIKDIVNLFRGVE